MVITARVPRETTQRLSSLHAQHPAATSWEKPGGTPEAEGPSWHHPTIPSAAAPPGNIIVPQAFA